MLARARGAARHGVEARLVDVEVDVAARGVSTFRLVGLSPSAARGMEQRVVAALRNGGMAPPARPVTVNFAPASLPKEGPPLDLALAGALMAAAEAVPRDSADSTMLHGELSLDGTVRPVAGALAAAEAARAARIPRLACARSVAAEAAAVAQVEVHPVDGLADVVAVLRGLVAAPPKADVNGTSSPSGDDLSDVRGQLHARRALEIAAAGHHGLLLVGPPGAGKSMLARRLPGLMPPLSRDEALEVTRIHSAAGLLLGSSSSETSGILTRRPFRSPHHSLSAAGLVGGGRMVAPGEATLAHHGVLFLDELPEFRRDALEGLRQPLEDGRITIVRSGDRATLPCRFLLVGAMNPCHCGWHGCMRRSCSCSDAQVERYRARVSGPLLDRLDLQVEVPALRFEEIHSPAPGEASGEVRVRVLAARGRQLERARQANGRLAPAELRRVVELAPAAESLLAHAVDRLGLSGRAHDRTLKVALTIHDLSPGASDRKSGRVKLEREHLAEALSYRLLDRPVPPTAPRLTPDPTARSFKGSTR